MRLIAGATLVVLLSASIATAQALPAFNTARLYTTEADFTRAIQPYAQAVAANARNARAQYWLGYAHLYAYTLWLQGGAPYASGFLPKAIDALNKAIEADPRAIAPYLALHDAYVLAGEDDKANDVTARMLENTRPRWLAPIPAPPSGSTGR
jgi:tetratricopeptide (TPR) repeat protein